MSEPIEPPKVAAALIGLLEWAQRHAPERESEVHRRLSEHFGHDPVGMPVVTETVGTYEHPNLQVAIDSYLAAPDREHDLFGLSSVMGMLTRGGLAELAQRSPMRGMPQAGVASVQYATVEVGERSILCVETGLYLIRDGAKRVALLVMPNQMHQQGGLKLEAMADERDDAERLLADLRELRRERNVYRGSVVSVEEGQRGLQIAVTRLPSVTRERIVLPAGVLDRIERHTIEFARHAERLRAAGRHLKRGLLLHGAPGTGKTLTAMYLASRMPERTTLLLTGQALKLIKPSFEMARALRPATVVMEDVDLVAFDRRDETTNVLLFELLNQMDGLEEDSDVLVLLTTNRVSALEPALASRPGRVDEAVELPLPEADDRRRLLELYGEGLDLPASRMARVVERTEGASPAFIREVTRRAALLAAGEGTGPVRVTEAQLEQALDDLERSGGELAQSLLGARRG
jgi:SpoVK/Ycf46/Vps4 family AAA+-type ATPase